MLVVTNILLTFILITLIGIYRRMNPPTVNINTIHTKDPNRWLAHLEPEIIRSKGTTS